ncbi:hypothetical protein [Streptomyces sp. WZ.A104]|uniref:hypothetical protein n=1 Tax=Streptomyces sp. WZ.A104 TaxID=2023771 RepID=UPI0027B9127F|nr:hypothetical protein [Streptomyces sp. WZ.A104]
MAALTWLPGTLPWGEAQWPVVTAFALALVIFVAAMARMVLTGADRGTMWRAFRCLPGRAQAGLAVLAVSAATILALGMAGTDLQAPEARDGRYYAYDTSPRGTVEIPESEYRALQESGLRMMLAIPGLLLVTAAGTVLAAGELRRADRGQKTGVPFTGGSR